MLLVHECELLGPVVVAGDFNVYLGEFGCPKEGPLHEEKCRWRRAIRRRVRR